MAPILTKEHGRIDWSNSAAAIANRIRGFLPWPGCYTEFRKQTLHIWRARVSEESSTGMPGTIVTDRRRFLVRCAQGSVLEVLEVQSEGRKRMPADAFRNGIRLDSNEQLGIDRRIDH
jgi:methionyl-tRNA formyltransferase